MKSRVKCYDCGKKIDWPGEIYCRSCRWERKKLRREAEKEGRR